MFHWMHLDIIKGECGLMKSSRETCTFYISCERGLSNLTQRLVHGIIPKALRGGLLFLRLWWYSSSQKKVSLGGVLDLCLYVASSVSSKNSSESGDELLRHAQRNSFFNWSISRCMSLSFFAWETWLFPCDWLLLVCVVCTLPSWSPLCWRFTTELLCWEPPDSAWCRLAWSWCGLIVGWCGPNSSIFNAKPESSSDQIKFFPQMAPILRTNFGLDPKQDWVSAQQALTINL